VAGSWKTEEDLSMKAQKLRTELQLDALLITRSEDGMSLYQPMKCGMNLHKRARYSMSAALEYRDRHAGGDVGKRCCTA